MAALFDTLTALATLRAGFDKVEENHGCAGVDGQTIEVFSASLEPNLSRLQTELRTQKYRPQSLLVATVPKASGGERRLSIPTVRDRVAQSAAAIVLTPILDPEMEDVSYAYRKGRSVDQAIRRVMRLRDQGYHWVLDADIRRFFDEIPRDRLLQVLSRHVDDADLLDLIKLWLYTDVQDGDRTYRLTAGVPQGSPISPLLANLYLDRLDEPFLERHFQIVRFADDYVILCRDRGEAEQALALSEEALRELGLELNRDKTVITHFDRGFDYLGVHFLRSLAYRPIEEPVERLAVPTPPSLPREAVKVATPPQGTGPVATALKTALDTLPPGESARRWTEIQASHTPADEPESDDPDDFPPPSAGHNPTLRTLYMMEQGTELRKEDERFVVTKSGQETIRIPAFKVDQILVFGNIHLTTPAIQFCLLQDIPIFLLSSRGRYYGVIESTSSDRAVLHAKQFHFAEDETRCLALAKRIVQGKIHNSAVILSRRGRRLRSPGIHAAVAALDGLERHVEGAASLNALRGLEGAAAARYFSTWAELIDPEWDFHTRKRQPPTDPVNSLLSYGYTLLFYNTYSMVRAAGLHPYAGIYHSLRANHPSLVSDLIEEFRAPIVDATVLMLLTRQRITPQEFERPDGPNTPCLLSPPARRKFTMALETAFNSRIAHPDGGEETDQRRAIFLQAQRFARVIAGDAPTYEPFLIR